MAAVVLGEAPGLGIEIDEEAFVTAKPMSNGAPKRGAAYSPHAGRSSPGARDHSCRYGGCPTRVSTTMRDGDTAFEKSPPRLGSLSECTLALKTVALR